MGNMVAEDGPSGPSPVSRSPDTMTCQQRGGDDNETPLTQHYLLAVSNNLKEHFSDLIEKTLEPLKSQLNSLNSSLKVVATMVEKAFKLATAQEKCVADLTAAESSLKERVIALELKARALTLKFRGGSRNTRNQ